MEQVHNHNTRSQTNGELSIPFARTKLGATALSHQIPSNWNEIPQSIRTLPFINQFKFNFKNYLLDFYDQE